MYLRFKCATDFATCTTNSQTIYNLENSRLDLIQNGYLLYLLIVESIAFQIQEIQILLRFIFSYECNGVFSIVTFIAHLPHDCPISCRADEKRE